MDQWTRRWIEERQPAYIRKNYGLIEIATAKGEAFRQWFYSKFSDHRATLGLTIMCVTFGNGSGWCAIQVTIGLLFWEWTVYPLRWRSVRSMGWGQPVKSFSEEMAEDNERFRSGYRRAESPAKEDINEDA